MTARTWQNQVRDAWSAEGRVGNLLDLLGVSDAEKNLVDRLVGLETSTLSALESLEGRGQAELVQRVLDAARHALEN